MGGEGTPLNSGAPLPSGDTPGYNTEAAVLSWLRQFAPYGLITLDPSFRVRSWNHWMEQHAGKSADEVIAQSLFSLYPDLRQRNLSTHLERALAGESSMLSTALHRYLLPLPSPFPEKGLPYMLQTARISPLISEGATCGVVIVIEDVTQRETQAQALARQHRRDELLSWALAHLLETEQPRKAVRQLFFKIAEQLDLDTFLIYLRNGETGQLTLDTVGGVPLESDADFVDCPFQSVLNGQPQDMVVFNSLPALGGPECAKLRQIGVTAAVLLPLIAKNHHLGLLCFGTCTREQIAPEELELLRTIARYLASALDRENTNLQLRRAQELLRDEAQLLESRVQERTARLRETISELETFSYTIAHDLRAPARSMSGFCEVLLEDFGETLPPGARGPLQRIAQASRRMENLTHDLLKFSKVSRQEILLSAVDISSIIEDLTTLRLPAVRKAITIQAPLHPVLGHRGLLEQVFSNLIDNAVKFVPPGISPKITISSEEVETPLRGVGSRTLLFSSGIPTVQEIVERNAETPGKTIRVWVRDEGIGVPREIQQKIFGIFERGMSSQTYEGTGIGLAIVARAMQRMRGACGVESEPGHGSAFWLELPSA